MSLFQFAVLPVALLSLFSATAYAETEAASPAASAATSSLSPDPDASQSEARAERPHHEGLTLELGLGASLMNVAPDQGQSKTSFGLAPLSFSVGGFLSHDVAFLLRGAGSSYFENDKNGDTQQYVNAFYGAHIQYWINDDLMISAGPGITTFGKNQQLSPGAPTDVGYGASLRVGYDLLTTKHHALRISYEAFPSIYDKAFVFGNAINFEWQYF